MPSMIHIGPIVSKEKDKMNQRATQGTTWYNLGKWVWSTLAQ